MAVDVQEPAGGKTLEVHASGKLSADDYHQFVPVAERLIQQSGKIRILFAMQDFHGWEAGALWQDIKFDVKHFKDIERLAMVGDRKWEAGMAHFCKPFTTAKIKYFDVAQLDAARAWLADNE